MDQTFATAKYIRDAELQSVYKAVLTVVNEHSQLVAQWFTHTTSLYEVRKGLRLLRDRYKGEDVKVSRSAPCLHMRSMMDAIQLIRMRPCQSLRYAIAGARMYMGGQQ